jgi:GNAT superfamily N-acetyltransferase
MFWPDKPSGLLSFFKRWEWNGYTDSPDPLPDGSDTSLCLNLCLKSKNSVGENAMLKIRKATDTDDLQPLWTLCFSESGETYFRLHNRVSRRYVATNPEGIISMVHAIGQEIDFPEGKARGAYLLGIGTHPGYRKQGIARALIEFCLDDLRDTFDFAFLIPASESLNRYYTELGFRECGWLSEDVPPAPLPAWQEDSTGPLNDLYEKNFVLLPHVVRSPMDWEAICAEYEVYADSYRYQIRDNGSVLEDSAYLSVRNSRLGAMRYDFAEPEELEVLEYFYANLLYN